MEHHVNTYSHDLIDGFIAQRPGEVHLGQKMDSVKLGESIGEALKRTSAPFVLLGIPEDIGIRGNLGNPGSREMWDATLPRLLNVQSTDLLTGGEFLLLGAFDLYDLLDESDQIDQYSGDGIKKMRELTAEVDERVKPVIDMVCEAGKIPILVGGGHNNAYPIIAGSALGVQRSGKRQDAKINVINLDAHADFREQEGRHSGNGFRYAYESGSIAKYSACLIHENYNSQEMLEALAKAKEHVRVSFFEQEMVRKAKPYYETLEEAIHFLDDVPTGIELDLDSVAGIHSSAQTPSGVTPEQARIYVTHCARELQPAYLHICEGIPDGAGFSSKLIAYLITDFAKEYLRYH